MIVPLLTCVVTVCYCYKGTTRLSIYQYTLLSIFRSSGLIKVGQTSINDTTVTDLPWNEQYRLAFH